MVRASLILAVCLSVGISYGGMLVAGKYNGVVIFDRWDGCHLYTGTYQLEISEKVKEQLRPYRGKAMLIDAQEVHQPMNPGDAIVTRLQVLGEARDTTPPHISPPARVDGLSLRVVPSFAEAGPNELVLELRNLSGERRRVNTQSLGPTLLTRQKGGLCFTPADGPSFPVVTRTTVASLQQSGAPNMCGTLPRPIDVELTLAPGFAVAETRVLEPGEVLEIPLRIAVSEGEYEFLAGYGSSYQGPALSSNLVDFDADHPGQLRLIGEAALLNRPKTVPPAGAVCGKVTMSDGRGAARARVILWPAPFQKAQPRAVDEVTASEDGTFRFENIAAGKYILSATRSDGRDLFLGALRGTLPSDAPPVALPDQTAGCTLQFSILPQTLYIVRGRTSPEPGRTVRMILKNGDAIPFEQSAKVQPDGWYEFRVPAGQYQFFAGNTGSGFEVSGNIDDIGIGISWPKADGKGSGMPEMGVEFNESLTRVKLMALGEAQRTYEKTYHHGFSTDLASLGPPPEWLRATKDHAGLRSDFGTFVKLDNDREYVEFDYRVTYTPGPADESGKIATFTISARPVRLGKTGNRSFLLDESGVVRATSADRPATKDDPEAER